MSTTLEVTCDPCGAGARLVQHEFSAMKVLPPNWITLEVVVNNHYRHQIHLCPQCVIGLQLDGLPGAIRQAIGEAKRCEKEMRQVPVGSIIF